MSTYTWFVVTRAKPGRLEDYEEWYDRIHFKEVCAKPGVVSGQRHKVLQQDVRSCEQPAWDSIAIYELDGDDPVAIEKAIKDAWDDGLMDVCDAMAPESITLITKQHLKSGDAA